MQFFMLWLKVKHVEILINKVGYLYSIYAFMKGVAMVQKLVTKIRSSIWFTPTVYSLIAIVISIYVGLLDRRALGNIKDRIPHFMFTDFELAKQILSTIATALLTMITFTFSTMMIVLTMYSSQFSPRSLPNFLRDRKSTTVLGVFMGSFIYSIISLFFLTRDTEAEGMISAVIGIGLVFLCLAFFTFFIYHVTTSIQVESLIERLNKDALKTIDKNRDKFKKNIYYYIPDWQEKSKGYKLEVCSPNGGYIQMVDYEGLTKEAKKHKAVIRIISKIGKFVTDGEILAILYCNEPIDNGESYKTIRDKFTIENQRSTVQDIEFSIEKLVDIALRAISPGINDPNTAKESIYAIGMVLAEIGSNSKGKIGIKDGDGKLRVVMEGINFKELLYITFYQLRHYGSSDISIMLSNLEALTIAAQKASIENKNTIWGFHKYIVDKTEVMELKELDRIYLQNKIRSLKSTCST
jgi:uncharacterized membrane protein